MGWLLHGNILWESCYPRKQNSLLLSCEPPCTYLGGVTGLESLAEFTPSSPQSGCMLMLGEGWGAVNICLLLMQVMETLALVSWWLKR